MSTRTNETLLPFGAAEPDKALSPKGRFPSQNFGDSPHVGRIFIPPGKEKFVMQDVQFVFPGFRAYLFELFVNFAHLSTVALDLHNNLQPVVGKDFVDEG